MKLLLESTADLALLNERHGPVECRRWVGTAIHGDFSVPVQVFIVRIAVAREYDVASRAMLASDPHILDRGVGDTADGPSRPRPIAEGGAIDARLLR